MSVQLASDKSPNTRTFEASEVEIEHTAYLMALTLAASSSHRASRLDCGAVSTTVRVGGDHWRLTCPDGGRLRVVTRSDGTAYRYAARHSSLMAEIMRRLDGACR